MTTIAELDVSTAAFDEIAAALRAAGYSHAFLSDRTIDMTGIALHRKSPRIRPYCECRTLGPDYCEVHAA